MSEYRLRPYHPTDVRAEGIEYPAQAFGMTVTREGEVVAYGGAAAISGRWVVFFWLGDEQLRRPMLMHRYASRWLRSAWAIGVDQMLVFPDRQKRRAIAWLGALGFRPVTAAERDGVVRALEESTGSGAWVYDRNGAACADAARDYCGSDSSVGGGSHQGRQYHEGADGLRGARAAPAG